MTPPEGEFVGPRLKGISPANICGTHVTRHLGSDLGKSAPCIHAHVERLLGLLLLLLFFFNWKKNGLENKNSSLFNLKISAFRTLHPAQRFISSAVPSLSVWGPEEHWFLQDLLIPVLTKVFYEVSNTTLIHL